MQINRPHPKEQPNGIQHSKTMSHTQARPPERHSSPVPQRTDALEHTPPLLLITPTPPHVLTETKNNKARNTATNAKSPRRVLSSLHEVHCQVFARGESEVSRGIGPLFQQWRPMGRAWVRWGWAVGVFDGRVTTLASQPVLKSAR